MLNNPKYRDKPLFITRKYSSIKAYKIGFNLSSINTNVISYTPIHLARHTFATLILTLDVDLYTTSKLLGHKNIATTQIYAKIIDQKKDDAVNRVDEIFK